MPVGIPPQAALKEFLGSTTRHTRRVEIYEQDGVTRWSKDTVARLQDGQVSIDYDRDERRSLDLTLSNTDGVLINAPGEFWYDKIVKVYRGVRVMETARLPKILVIADRTGDQAAFPAFRDAMVLLGFGDVRYDATAETLLDVAGYDIIVSLNTTVLSKRALIRDAYNAGKRVMTFGYGNPSNWPSFFPNGLSVTLPAEQAAAGTSPKAGVTHPVARGWSVHGPAVPPGPQTVTTAASVGADTTVIAQQGTGATVLARESAERERRWVMYAYEADDSLFDVPQFRNFLLTAFNWLNNVKPLAEWEVQIGEFMIDRITESNRPRSMKITGRDYVKKCQLSKFPHATQFEAGITLEQVIEDIAGAAGITKRVLPATGIVIGRTFFFERGTERWAAMKEIATAYDHEIFFDATGYLVIRPYNDPATTAPVLYVQTGPDGTVASWEKSTSDSRLINHFMVFGESSDAETIPVWGEWINNDPNSKTSVQEIGDRYGEYSSSFIETTEQAQALADSMGPLGALEEYELSFENLVLPWLEAGDILGWIDPNPAPDDPNTFLLANFTIPLKLGPMSASAKRVTAVGG